MPLYFATIKKAGQRTQLGAGGSEFNRTSPSELYYKLMGHNRFQSFDFLLPYLGSVTKAISDTPGTWNTIQSSDMYLFEGRAAVLLPLQPAPIAMRFKGNPPQAIVDRLEDLGTTVVKMPGTNKDTFLVSGLEYTSLGEIAGWMDYTESFRPPQGHITVDNIQTVARIQIAIYGVARALRAIAGHGYGVQRDSVSLKIDTSAGAVQKEALEEGEEGVARLWWNGINRADETTVQIKADINISATEIICKPESIVQTEGLVAAFESSLSAPDPGMVARFLRQFSACCFDDGEEEEDMFEGMVAAWAQQICRTELGEWLAHMMLCCEITAASGGYPQFVSNDSGEYQGAILVNGRGKVYVANGQVLENVTGAPFRAELQSFTSRDTLLEQIRVTAGLDTLGAVVGMRSLSRRLCMGGQPSEAVKVAVLPLAKKLRFSERPTPVNAQTIQRMLTLLGDQAAEIPEDTFMPWEALFPKSRTEEVLSMFGSTVPSFNFGGPRTVNASPVMARGAKVEYSPTPPKVFQVKRLSLQVASQQYQTMLQNGLIGTETERATPGSRVFPPSQSKMIWDTLGKVLEKTVVRVGGENVAAAAGVRRGQEDPRLIAGGEFRPAKRVKTLL